jgi:hypothetical protein
MGAINLTKESRQTFSSTLWVVGLVLIASYPIAVISSILPLQPLEPAWQLNLITNLVDNGGIPLIGLVCLQAAAQFSPAHSRREGIHASLANLSLGVMAGFLLLLPLQLVASLNLYETIKSEQVGRVERGTRRLDNLSQAITRATRAEELQAELQKFDGLSLGPGELALPLPRLKEGLLERIGKARRQLEAQLPPPGQHLSWPMIQSSLRIVPTALAYAVGFAATGRRRGQRISLLDELRALNNQSARNRQERRRNRQAFLKGVEDARMEQAMLAEEHLASAPLQDPGLNEHQQPAAGGPSPIPSQERGGRQRGPVDLAYFEELSRLDEPSSQADPSDETPN